MKGDRSMKTRTWLALGLASLFLSGCQANEGAEGEMEGDVTTTTIEGTEVIHIGFSGPLSGSAAYYGQNALSGLTMAVDEINEAGGIDVAGEAHSLNVVTLDDKYLPNETGANTRRLVQEYDTPIIYVPHSGGIFATQVFNEKEEFLLAAFSSEPDITQQDNGLTYRLPPTYDHYVDPFASYQMDRFGPKIAMLPTNTQYGLDWADELRPHWEAMGGEIVYDGTVDFSKDTDFFTIVTNALRDDPDVLFVGGSSEPTGQVMKQARELGFEGGFLIMEQAKLDEIANVFNGDLTELEGSVGVAPLSYNRHEGNAAFIDKYEERYDKVPGSEAGYHYFSMYILTEAIKAAGTATDAYEIRAHLNEGLKEVPPEYQLYDVPEIDEGGGMVTSFTMAVIEDGEVVLTVQD